MSDDDDQFLIDGRPVPELKVVELRKELEQRSLPKSGNKKELVDRLLNYFREEQAERNRQQQQVQQQNAQLQQQQAQAAAAEQAVPTNVPDMVAQYLAQQQVQLEAARRSADKLRASTSSLEEDQEQPSEMVTGNEEPPQQQQIADEAAKIRNEADQEQTPPARSPEFIPEEPTNGITAVVAADKIQTEKEGKDGDTGSEVDEQEEQRSTSSESSATEQEENEPQEDEDTTAANEEAADEVGQKDEEDEEKEAVVSGDYEEQATERVEDVEQMEEEDVERAQQETSVDFIPEEPSESKSLKTAEQSLQKKPTVEVVQSSAPSALNKSAGEDELDYEQELAEEDEEEREEPDDGKRHRITTEVKQQQMVQDSHVSSVTSEANKAGMVPGVEVVTNEKPPQTSTTTPQPLASRRRSSAAAGLPGHMESSKVPPAAIEPEITTDGFTRPRPLSPARHSVTRWIHIRGLKRPFTQRALFEMLGKFGTVDVDAFWIDDIKSNCIVTYETEEQAQTARDRLHNVIWPQAGGEALIVEFSNEDKLNRRKEEKKEENDRKLSTERLAPPMPVPRGLGLTIVVNNQQGQEQSGPRVLLEHNKEQQREIEHRKRKAEELEKSQQTLDEHFKKTKTQPSLYFMPLSDEEAAKRHSNSSTKQPRTSSAHSHQKTESSGNGSHRDRVRTDSHRTSRDHRDRDRPSGSNSRRW